MNRGLNWLNYRWLDAARVYRRRRQQLRWWWNGSRAAWWWAARSGAPIIVCIGDSHLQAVEQVAATGALPGTVFRVFSVTGATASGVNNPNGRTGSHTIFKRALAHAPAGTAVLISLGEIDAGFLAFWKAQQSHGKLTPAACLVDAATRYTVFIETEVLGRGLRPLILSATYPTVEDYATWGGLSGARRTVTASHADRVDMTDLWNRLVAETCSNLHVAWLDLTPATVAAGTVRPEFVSADPADHHYAVEPHAALVAGLLAGEGFA